MLRLLGIVGRQVFLVMDIASLAPRQLEYTFFCTVQKVACKAYF